MNFVELLHAIEAGKQAYLLIGAILALLVFLWRGRNWIAGVWRNVRYLCSAREMQENILESLNEIKEQMKPNGGNSIRDSLNRIERRQERDGAFLKTQLNAHHKALFECDASGRCVWTNRPHTHLTGFTLDQMRGMGWINLVAANEREAVMSKWMRAVNDKREFDDNITYLAADGSRYLVHVNAYVIRHEETGEVLGFLGEVTPQAQPDEIPISTSRVTV